MAQLLAANNAASTLANSITNSSTSANLQAGTGALFPQPDAGQYFVLTFTSQIDPTDQEIVHVTSITGDTITMTRAQEGTTAQNWTANDLADNLMTAGQLETLVQQYQVQNGAFTFAVDTGSANTYLCALTPAIPSAPPEGFSARVLITNPNTGPSTINFGWGIVNIVRRDLSALIGGELLAGQIAEFNFDGVHAQLQGMMPATDAAIAAGTDSESGVTPAQLANALGTQKLLAGQCRLLFTSTTEITLFPFNGNLVPVAGAGQSVPAAGIAAANTNVTVNGVGAQNLAASSVYLVALNQSNALEFWSLGTGHSPSATAGNIGVEIITGHNTKTLVGMVRTNGSSQFADSDGARFVLSWFNRQAKRSRTTFTGNPTNAVTSMAELDASIENGALLWAGAIMPFSANGSVVCSVASTNVVFLTGIVFNGGAVELESCFNTLPAVPGFAPSPIVFGGNKSGLSEGYNVATLYGCSNAATSGGTATWQGGTTPATDDTIAPPCVLDLTVYG